MFFRLTQIFLFVLFLGNCEYLESTKDIQPSVPISAVEEQPLIISISDIVTGPLDTAADSVVDLVGHTGQVTSLAFSPDGRFLTSGSYDGSVRLWTIGRNEGSKILLGHDQAVLAVAVSPDGEYIASGGWDTRIILWNAKSGKKIKELRHHREGVSALAFTSDGLQLISGAFDGSLYIWDVETGSLSGSLTGHQMAVRAVAISPDDKLVASGGGDKAVHLWNLADFTEVDRFDGDTLIKALAFTPDGRFLVSGGADNKIIIWNLETGTQERTIGDSILTVNTLSVSKNGRHLLAADYDNVYIWDLETGEKIISKGKYQGNVKAAMFAPSGNKVASVDGQVIKVWDTPFFIRPDTEPLTTMDREITLSGTVIGYSPGTQVTLNGEPLIVADDGSFETSQQLDVGANDLLFTATDSIGNETKYSISVNRELDVLANPLPDLEPRRRDGVVSDNRVAIIIGIENYQNIPDALYAANDANRFVEFANNMLGIPMERIKQLIGRDATRTKILMTLTGWLKAYSFQPETEVFVFFSGHGLTVPDGANGFEAYLMPVDGVPTNLEDTAISRKRLFSELAAVNALSTIVFLDTCFSGITRNGASLDPFTKQVIIVPTQLLPEGMTVLSAASGEEFSIALDENLDDQKYGLFSYFLMRALEGEADESPSGNGDRQLTIKEIFDYVRPKVAQLAISRNRMQTPQLTGVPDTIIASW